MKIAIIGSKKYDSLEYNLNESFNYNNHQCLIFDTYDKFIFSNKSLNKITINLDWIIRRYSNTYDNHIFKELASKVNDYNPDLIICVYRFIHPIFVELVKKKTNRVIHINPDALTTFEYQQVFASNYDVWFTKDPYIVAFMKNNMHLNTKLYNEAFNKRIHVKPDLKKSECEDEINIDVMTYGTMYPYRCNMLKHVMDKGYKIEVYGTKPNRFYDKSLDPIFTNKYITGIEKTKILYGSKIVFNQMHFAEIESVNNRFFEVNGSGGFQLSDYRPILNELLPIDQTLVSFKSIDEGIEKIKYYLNNPEERFKISDEIFNHFINHYTYDHLIKYILSNLE